MVADIGDDLMGEEEIMQQAQEMCFESDVHVLTERHCDTNEKCVHGCPALPKGNVIHAFLNAFTAGYNGATHEEERFVAAIQATKETYPEVWTDSNKLELAVSILVVNGTESILDGNLKDARNNVAFACFFDQWIDYLQDEAKTSADRATIAELLNAGDNTVMSFLRKRIPCTCLNGERNEVKSLKCTPSASAGDSSPTDTTMEVTITLLSLTGVVTKKHASKNMVMKNRPSTTNGRTSLVASFSQNLSEDITASSASPMTHVPSFPIDVSRSQPIVRWQSHLGQVLSTLRFQVQFQAAAAADEDADVASSSTSKRNRFIPRTCPINISLSRNGKLATLGRANLVISGDEQGESSIMVPVARCSNNKAVSSRKEWSIPMMKVKGDDLLLGLKSDSTLRVLVSVTDAVKSGDITQDNPLSYGVAKNDFDLSFEHFLDFIIGAKSADDIRRQRSLNVPGLSFDAIEKDEQGKDAPVVLDLNETMPLSEDESDSDEMGEEDMMQQTQEMCFESDVHVLTERHCDTNETCAHGCPALPDGHVIHEFLNAFTAGFNGATHEEERFVAAIQATREAYPEVWTDSNKLELVISILVANGTESILDNNLQDARNKAALACFFEQWIDCLQDEAKTSADRATIAELLSAGENAVVSFLRKRIPCTCLNGERNEVKSLKKACSGMRGKPCEMVQSIAMEKVRCCHEITHCIA